MKPAACQCAKCLRYLTRNRERDDDLCIECAHDTWSSDIAERHGIPLAEIRGPLADPLSVELLGLLTEECGEVSQRVGKIMRWGWDADFEGTTQQHRLETELGDVLAVLLLLIQNGLVDSGGVRSAVRHKIAKLLEDALGPRQRLTVANVLDDIDIVFE